MTLLPSCSGNYNKVCISVLLCTSTLVMYLCKQIDLSVLVNTQERFCVLCDEDVSCIYLSHAY